MILDDPVELAIHRMAAEFPGGILRLARELERQPGTFVNQVSGQPGHQIGLRTLRQALHRTGDLRPLYALNAEFGLGTIPIEPDQDADAEALFNALARLGMLRGAHDGVLMETLDDNRVEPHELERYTQAVHAEIRALTGLLRQLQSLAAAEGGQGESTESGEQVDDERRRTLRAVGGA